MIATEHSEFLDRIFNQPRFNYELPKFTSKFSTNAPGKLDPNRFLMGLPAWEVSSTGALYRRKTLIIADSSMPFWSPRKRDTLELIVKTLLEKLFSIYVLTPEGLKMLTSEDYGLPRTHEDIRIKKLHDLIDNSLWQLCSEMNLNSDKCFILDELWMDHLCVPSEEMEPQIRMLSLYQLQKLEDIYPSLDLSHILHLDECIPIRIVDDVFSIYKSLTSARIIKQYFPSYTWQNIVVQRDDKPWFFEYDNDLDGKYDAFLKSNDDRLKEIQFFKMHASYGDEEFDGYEFHNYNEVRELLASMTNLRALYLSISIENVVTDDDKALSFPLLDEFICHSGLTESAINLIIAGSPKLKAMYLGPCTAFNFNDVVLEFPCLERVNFVSARTRDDKYTINLQEKFGKIKRLKELSIYGPKIESFSLSNVTFDALRLLSLNGSEFDDELNFADIFRAAPNLEKFSSEIPPTLNLEDFNWPPLLKPTLILAKRDAFSEQLHNLLHHFPHVTELEIVFACIDFVPDITIEKRLLSNITSLTCVNCPGVVIEILLHHASELKQLIINNMPPPGYFPKLDRFNCNELPCLEEIHVERFERVNYDALKTLVSNAPKLRNKTYLEEVLIDMQKKNKAGTSVAKVLLPPPPPAIHDYKSKISYTPKSYYSSGNATYKNQNAIIQKLTQYLPKDSPLIPRIQNGICLALSYDFYDFVSYYFSLISQTPLSESWENNLSRMLDWNGDRKTLTPLLVHNFDNLIQFIHKYQLKQSTENQVFLGENNLHILLENMNCSQAIILCNPWHSVAVCREDENTFLRYDPNQQLVSSTLEQLIVDIQIGLGNLISLWRDFEWSKLSPVVLIDNHSQFLEEGGLISLVSNSNAADISANLLHKHYKNESLTGLLLRDTRGIPAWVLGMNCSIDNVRYLTVCWIQQFFSCYEDAQEQLQKSMNAMESLKRHELMVKIIQATRQDSLSSELQDNLLQICRMNQRTNYEQQLETWTVNTSKEETFHEFCDRVLCPDEHLLNRLIECNENEASPLSLILEKRADSRPVFYADTHEDLICSSPFLFRRADNSGEFRAGPGGPLYDFLQAYPESILIVNSTQFPLDKRPLLNDLLQRRVDGEMLSDKIILIVLAKPGYYRDSRFQMKEQNLMNQIALEELLAPRPVVNILQPSDNPSAVKINLFHDTEWKSQLLGQWSVRNGEYVFREGALQRALSGPLDIEIENGLWVNEDFKRFWLRLTLVGWLHAGNIITIPESKTVYASEKPYMDFSRIKYVDGFSKGSETLNQGCLPNFLNPYAYDELSKFLRSVPGLIEQYKQGGELHVNLTHDIPPSSWGKLQAMCEQHEVNLVVHQQAMPIEQGLLDANDEFEVIVSTDVDTTVACLIKDELDWRVINVSSCEAHDLLLRLEGGFDAVQIRPVFEQIEGALLKSLRECKKIILKGNFSQSLVDSLSRLLLSHQDEPEKSCFKVVASNDLFSFISRRYHDVRVEDKLYFLNSTARTLLSQEILEKESLSRLRARMCFLAANPTEDSNDAWRGLVSLPGKALFSDEPFDVMTSAEKAAQFFEKRKKTVLDMLERTPYVFLTGLSGVGKTTFVREMLCKEGVYRLFEGEEKIKDWAKQQQPGILFLDEANLSPRAWNEFEGLFDTPAGILVDGEFYPLTPHHKVVFAGNPVSYGDERTLAGFFERHGNAVLFNPLSQDVIYEHLLKPVFEGIELPHDTLLTVCQRILEVYRFICECSFDEILISPRELQMMALLFVSKYQDKQMDWQIELNHVVYEIGRSLIPNHAKVQLTQFNAHFKPERTSVSTSSFECDKGLLVMPSRQNALKKLEERLVLREWRINNQARINEVQKYGGLGGLIVESEVGCDTEELLIHTLTHHGYEEEHTLDGVSNKSKPFYRMPASWSIAQKTALLIKAFHEGSVVLSQDMNTSSMMERLLNGLLMGQCPTSSEEVNLRPKKTGFILVATQNPGTQEGRLDASTALKRRVSTIVIPPYTPQELREIAIARKIAPLDADKMIEAYFKQVRYALRNKLSPAPCFRDFLALKPPTLPKFATPVTDSSQVTEEKRRCSSRFFGSHQKRKHDDDKLLASKKPKT